MAKRWGKRNQQKESLWREQVRQQAQSGLSVRAYCQQHELTEPSFYAWRKALAKRDLERQAGGPTMSAPATSVQASRAPFPAFTEVVLTSPAAACLIEIVLADSRRIAVSPGFDPQTLQAVLEVLERPRC